MIMSKPESYRSRERGFVSLFTVIFFMLLISVITIGFIRVMSVEQRQALDNDLTANALSAAESGVEDAKRAIIRYVNEPSGAFKNALRGALNSNDCDRLFTTNSIATALGLSSNGSVTGQADSKQFYTCLTVQLNSPDYVSSSGAGESEFIPLKPVGVSQFNQVRISWHLASSAVGAEGDGQPDNYPPNLRLPQVVGSNPSYNWTTKGYPAYIRAQLYGYPNGSFNRDNLNDRSRTVVLVPRAPGISTPISTSSADPSHNFYDFKSGVVSQSQCVGTASNPNVPIGTYACTATIELPNDPGLRGNNNNYFLRLTPLYGATHFKVEMLNSTTNSVIDFNEVQPIIDSTGRANDVFRRVQARVQLNSMSNVPEYVVETADDICKTMQVSDGSFYQPNNCP